MRIMENTKNIIVVKIPQKIRAHRALFDADLPFKNRVETSQKLYKRNKKHRKNNPLD
jgi:hypothetical protein